MKNDFLTIPDAPNYEINSELVVRSKRTGRILKLHKDNRVELKEGCHSIHRTPKTLRAQAEAVTLRKHDDFVPIPSLNYLYEINSDGKMRHAISKRYLTPKKSIERRTLRVDVSIRGKITSHSVATLLWEAHGIIPAKIFQQAISTTIYKDGAKIRFPSLLACANWLATRIHYRIGTIRHFLSRRRSEICGWHIIYHEEKDLSQVTTTVQQALGKQFVRRCK